MNDCCKNPNNLTRELVGQGDRAVDTCKVCKRRHYVMLAEVGNYDNILHAIVQGQASKTNYEAAQASQTEGAD
jgi:hypothetical protein